jgi:hypothetical protein
MESLASPGQRWYVSDHGIVQRCTAEALTAGSVDPELYKHSTLREAIKDAKGRTV